MNSDLVLDTCTFLWLVVDAGRLTDPARAAIEGAEAPVDCAISLTEIHRLLRIKRIRLPCTEKTLKRWFDRALDHHRVVCQPVTADVANTAELLPWHHRDPADRFILATARMNRCPVVSSDSLFSPYRVRVIW